jgi:hypothetical protein
MYFRLQTQSTDPETLTADWFRDWGIQIPGHNPTQVARIPTKLEYLRQFEMDVAYITPQQESETCKAYNSRLYNTTVTLLNKKSEPPRCESHTCDLPHIGHQYGITYTRHRYLRIQRRNGTGPYII